MPVSLPVCCGLPRVLAECPEHAAVYCSVCAAAPRVVSYCRVICSKTAVSQGKRDVSLFETAESSA